MTHGLVCMPAGLEDADRLIRRAARAMTRTFRHMDHEDLAQEARLKVWLDRDLLDSVESPEHRERLIRLLVRRAFFDAMRRPGWRYRPAEDIDELEDAAVEPIGPEQHVQAAQQASRIDGAIARLPARLRDLWELMQQGLSGDAIAARWGITGGRVSQLRTTLFTALQRAVRT